MSDEMTITGLVQWFGSNRKNAHLPGMHMAGCSWIGIPFCGSGCEIPHMPEGAQIVACDAHDEIIALFTGWGFGTPGTSQDIAKAHAARLTCSARINTVACFGNYIGMIGQNFNEAKFQEMGFGSTVIAPAADFRAEKPTDSFIDSVINYMQFAGKQDVVPLKVGTREDVRQRVRRSGDELARRVRLHLRAADRQLALRDQPVAALHPGRRTADLFVALFAAHAGPEGRDHPRPPRPGTAGSILTRP